MHRATYSLLLLLACRPTLLGEPASKEQTGLETPPQAPPEPAMAEVNDAAQFVATADQITAVVVVDADRKPIGELTPTVVDSLRSSLLKQGIGEDLTATTPPWDIALQITVPGRAVFVVIPVGFDRGRLSPSHPYDARIADDEGRIDSRVREVTLGETVHAAIRDLVGPPVAKEFQTPSDGSSELDRWNEHLESLRAGGK